MPSSSVKRKTQNVHRWSSRRAPFYVLRLTFYVSWILAVVVEDPAATVAVDDLAAGLQDLHGGGPDLDMARGAGIADAAHDREASLSRILPSAFRSSSLITRCAARQSFIFSSCSWVSRGRFFSRFCRSSREVSSSSSSPSTLSSLARIFFSTPSISFRTALYSRLDCTLRSCAWYFFCFSCWSVSSAEARRCSTSASSRRCFSRWTASSFSRKARATSVSSAGTVSRSRSRLWTNRIRSWRRYSSSRRPLTQQPQRTKKGVPAMGHPRRFLFASSRRFLIWPLKLLAPLTLSKLTARPAPGLRPTSGGSTRIRTEV